MYILEKEREILAKLIASKIKNFFRENKFLASENRSIKFSDVMILLKERKSDLENLIIQNHIFMQNLNLKLVTQ